MGTLISRGLASGLNTAGATVLLLAIAATGLILATNFSFVEFCKMIAHAIGDSLRFRSRDTGAIQNLA